MLVEPYSYVRAITIGLGTLWTIGGFVRLIRFILRWRRRLMPLGFEDRWLRRAVYVAALRATILDPINLALMILLVSIWTFRAAG